MSSATLSELIDALEVGERLLLPNARSARTLRLEFDARQRARGLLTWEAPEVVSWAQWANSQWSELIVAGVENRLLLNAAQEHSLWREIIAGYSGNGSFGSADSLGELASSAWKLAADYNATHRLREFAVTHDSRVFSEWAEEFSKQCAGRGCLSAAMLEDALRLHVRNGTMAAPESIELVGFSGLLPSQAELLDELRERGAHVVERNLEAPAKHEQLRALVVGENEREELLLAACWIRNYLNQAHASERGACVAVLVPHLDDERAELEDVLRETLAPELQSIEADLSSTPWEFGRGTGLSTLTMIADALTLARWAEGPLPIARVSSLLLSPYVGKSGADRVHRDASARFDANRLRRILLLRSEIEISAVVKVVPAVRAESTEESSALAWLNDLHNYLQRVGDRNRLRSFAEWMEFVRGLTHSAGWPGGRALTASEFETMRAWESTLDLVSTLDFSGRRVDFSTALEALELQTQKTAYTPPSTGAPVQVLSFNDAEGSIFDAVVFLRATDANWPVSERANPLLSWAMQRSLKMPGGDPVRTATKSREFAEDLLKRSGSILFTYAAEDESGKLRPSPLLAQLGIQPIVAAAIVAPTTPIQKISLESVADSDKLPPLPSPEVTGGASVLKLQAACGFLAFAELRLRAREPRSGDLGLDAGESGSLLHRALQHFWKEIGSQETLRSMNWTKRDEVLTRSIDNAVSRRLQVRDIWDRAYLSLQKERLRSLLHRWLEEELRRGPFTICDVERSELVTVGPLTLDVRVDRIDTVGEGVFFVDYKTGYAADPKQWIGERPDDPQLPLYTLLPEAHELKGVAFAKVRAGRDMKWIGYQAEEGILPVASRSKVNVRDITSLVDEWRGTLARLAEDFAAGRADVRPKSFEVNCMRCAQRLLCRLDTASLIVATEDEEGDVDD